MDVLFVQDEHYLSKITASCFGTLKYGFCKLEHAEKDSHYHAQREQGQLE